MEDTHIAGRSEANGSDELDDGSRPVQKDGLEVRHRVCHLGITQRHTPYSNQRVDDTYFDTHRGTDREFLGRVFHFGIPHSSQRFAGPQPIHFVRQHDVDEFLETLT